MIDDSLSDIDLLRLAFHREGVTQQVDMVQTGRQAIDYLAAADPLPILILLDLKLPEIPGFELLQILRDDLRLKDVPIVVLTAFERSGDIDRAYALGANSFLTKPISFSDFQFTIAAAGSPSSLAKEKAAERDLADPCPAAPTVIP